MFKFLNSKKRTKTEADQKDRGILVFENTSEVIKAENVLMSNDWKIKVMGPPPDIRSGCDLVIEFPLIKELEIIRVLDSVGLKPLQVVPITSVLLEPVDLLQVKDFGKYLMIRAANMKITVDKKSCLIVNVSGGGCPDVPYLAEQMVNRHINDAPNPKDIGYTLCAYALQIAYDRMLVQCSV
jgi:hypothetical protein